MTAHGHGLDRVEHQVLDDLRQLVAVHLPQTPQDRLNSTRTFEPRAAKVAASRTMGSIASTCRTGTPPEAKVRSWRARPLAVWHPLGFPHQLHLVRVRLEVQPQQERLPGCR